jgi:hypothetical protein
MTITSRYAGNYAKPFKSSASPIPPPTTLAHDPSYWDHDRSPHGPMGFLVRHQDQQVLHHSHNMLSFVLPLEA